MLQLAGEIRGSGGDASAAVALREKVLGRDYILNGIDEKIRWELRQCIDQDLDDSCNLSSTLTVSGIESHSWAVSCREFVETTWPGEIAPSFMGKLEDVLSKTPPTESIEYEEPRWHMKLPSTQQESQVQSTIRYTGTVSEISCLAQLLAWISATFRLPATGKLMCSSVKIGCDTTGESSGEIDKAFTMSLAPLWPLQISEPGTCWIPLFPSTVMAYGFPTPKVEGTVGLRIPVGAMFELAEILYDVNLENDEGLDAGIYFDGTAWRLYPTLHVSESQTVQWHLSAKSPGLDHDQAVIPDHDGGPKWLRDIDFKTLEAATAILGYCSEVEIRLATKSRLSHYDRYKYARANIEDPNPEAYLSGISFGANLLGKVTTTLTTSFKPRKALTEELRKTKDKSYKDILKSSSKDSVILFETQDGNERAWMVPQLSVILDLYNFWAHQNGIEMRFARLGSDGSANAKAVLEDGEYANKVIQKKTLPKEEDITVGDKIKQIYGCIQKCITKDRTSESGARGTANIGHTPLPGWDWLELTGMGSNISHRRDARPKSHGIRYHPKPDWLPLTKFVPVFLGQDMGELITPAQRHPVCRHWHPLPRRLRLQLHGRQCSVFAGTIRVPWPRLHALGVLGPFGVGPRRCFTKRKKLQKPRPSGARLAISPEVKIPLNGALIFGCKRKEERYLRNIQPRGNDDAPEQDIGETTVQNSAKIPSRENGSVSGQGSGGNQGPENGEVSNRGNGEGLDQEIIEGETPMAGEREASDQESGEVRIPEIDEAEKGTESEVANRESDDVAEPEDGEVLGRRLSENDTFFDALEYQQV
ncbi:hypothetical protein PG985_001939 [Apiospora marii]|uniref:uncharacterized protein n=1 Tax=Apiospora marii TaxID=335849 RepID=UPI00312E418A